MGDPVVLYRFKKLDNSLYDIAILVVLYNKRILDSVTLTTLLHNKKITGKVKLIVWNNGPLKIKQEGFNFDDFDVEFIETLNNNPLSSIYNCFLNMVSSSKYVFLDHDTEISQFFIEEIIRFEGSLGIPKISCDNHLYSPTCNGKYVSAPFEKNQLILAVASGLVITQKIIKVIKSSYEDVFDERFRLYGVDTTFFIRVNKLCLTDRIEVLSELNHSLSKVENESEEVSKFRMIERSYDIALTLKYYPSFFILKTIFKQFLGNLLGRKKLISIPLILKAFYSGSHYKD